MIVSFFQRLIFSNAQLVRSQCFKSCEFTKFRKLSNLYL